MSNIVELPKAQLEPLEVLVEELEQLLAYAKRGELRGIVVATARWSSYKEIVWGTSSANDGDQRVLNALGASLVIAQVRWATAQLENAHESHSPTDRPE